MLNNLAEACVAADHVSANAAATAAANAAAGGGGGVYANHPNAVFATLVGATAPSRGGGGTRAASAFAATTGAQRSETAARLRMQHGGRATRVRLRMRCLDDGCDTREGSGTPRCSDVA